MGAKIAGFLFGFVLAAYGAYRVADPSPPQGQEPARSGPLYHRGEAPDRVTFAPPSFAPLVQRVKDAVVNITVRTRAPRRTIFDAGRMQEGQGSGFIVHQDGLVLTNLHVVLAAILDRGEGQILVGFADGSVVPAIVVAFQEETDLALLDLEGEGFPWVPLGDSRTIVPGDWIVAIGNPLGLGHTVTAGIVSATGRPLHISDRRYAGLEVENDFYLQVDTPINPGNSGGPLFDTAGEVVGIATSIVQGAEGIGFAIPAHVAMEFLDDFESGRSRQLATGPRGFLGIRYRVLSTRQDAWLYGINPPEGALVVEVQPGTPAHEAGLMRDDVILRYGEYRIGQDQEEFLRHIWGTSPGTEVSLDVLRRGRRLPMTIVVGDDRRRAAM